ncbi:S1 family peptidase [Metabacillus indicus]|uniref:S1 family peptidase n=1 Tax=Metabacillus indicus TaxID=246786 RepID=UPI00317DC38F
MKMLIKPLIIFLAIVVFQPIVPKVQAEELSNHEISESIKFREDFGLEQDPIIIAKKLYESKSLDSKQKFGYVLTVEEKKELDKRFINQKESVPKIQNYLKQIDGNDNIDIYIDQQDRGKIVLRIKDTVNENIVSKIKSDTDILSELPLDIKRVKYTESDLNYLTNEITSEIPFIQKLGIKLNGVYTDIQKGKVVISVQELDEKVRDTITERYNHKALEIVQEEASETFATARENTYIPIQGGILVKNNTSGDRCSTAFTASGGAGYYVVTAAHCGYIGDKFYQGWNELGPVTKGQFEYGVDAMTISITSNEKSNLVYGSTYKLTTQETLAQEVVGQAVCKSGMVTANTCGKLQTKNFTAVYEYATVTNLRRATLYSDNGDSGGTIYSGNKLIGVLSGGSGATYTYYSHIVNVNSALGIKPVLN